MRGGRKRVGGRKMRAYAFITSLTLEAQVAPLRLKPFICVAPSGGGVFQNPSLFAVKNTIANDPTA